MTFMTGTSVNRRFCCKYLSWLFAERGFWSRNGRSSSCHDYWLGSHLSHCSFVFCVKEEIMYLHKFRWISKSLQIIFQSWTSPFGHALTPNISLIIINRFSAFYGGEKATATYACISYIICIIYLILQGLGDSSQPLMSKYYGERKANELAEVKRMAYIFPVNLAFIGCAIMYFGRWHVGTLFGSSNTVNSEIAKIIPIF